MKDIHEVKDNQPLSFNHVHCRGVAARAGSVHLIYSIDRKLGQKGGDRTHPQQHHPVPQGGPFSKKFDRPPEAHRKSTNNANSTAQPGTMILMTFHHTPNTTTKLTSCVRGANPPPHNFTASPPARLCPPFHVGPPPH